ncbi:alpha-glucosidase [Marivivens donghaensis]|uniref:Alpha-glucosidase n=1 Tax=Marivivens donghaensis TaxID=1699413 RepID=A0ABX0VXQ1_9RHOB|nr:alpha-glucosidase [Marivivens donghaensis]NIY72876.1 alpha-glucosidase [Marivivens donghaensis]
MSEAPILSNVADKDWWRGAVIYQIYPRSYQDSNGDGVGDLCGIVERLPHIASMGVDAIWISPFFTSPMRDFGYDVSDYCDVDPMFGSLADFDAVVETAHSHGIRVMIDLVLSHTSDQHPWFKESRSSRDNDKSDWYVWSEPAPDGTPPNNWLSIFGGSGWQWDARREQYYMHNFLVSQPDLNFHNPDVQNALLDVAKFWLNRGVDGFRLDTINFYMHDEQLRDNPPLPKEERNADTAPAVNPYNHQRHLYDKNHPDNVKFLERLRAVMEPFGAAAVGEVGDSQRGLEILGEYTSGDNRMQMCYAFEFLAPERPSATRIVEVLNNLDAAAPEGWACWAFSNHDVVRHITRWDLSPSGIRAYTTLLATLRGSICIYQGEELGLPEAEIAFEDLQDPYGIEFWPEFKGRDGCRTPMVWDSTHQNGAFSDAKPWLPVPSEHYHLAVEAEETDPAALLHHYRRALRFRQDHPMLKRGTHSSLGTAGDVIHFMRSLDGEHMFVAINLSDTPSDLDLPAGDWELIGQELGGAHASADGKLHLGPWQPYFAIKRD